MDEVKFKRSAALELLAQTGMRRYSYAPPLVRLLWRLGINVPPPHFAGFWLNVVLYGSPFGVLFFVLNWPHQSLMLVLVFDVFGGVVFGLWMASRFRNGARKYNIPSWQAFQPARRS